MGAVGKVLAGSSAAEPVTVNHLVVGSIPTSPAKLKECTASLYAVAGRLTRSRSDPGTGLTSASQTATRVLLARLDIALIGSVA